MSLFERAHPIPYFFQRPRAVIVSLHSDIKRETRWRKFLMRVSVNMITSFMTTFPHAMGEVRDEQLLVLVIDYVCSTDFVLALTKQKLRSQPRRVFHQLVMIPVKECMTSIQLIQDVLCLFLGQTVPEHIARMQRNDVLVSRHDGIVPSNHEVNTLMSRSIRTIAILDYVLVSVMFVRRNELDVHYPFRKIAATFIMKNRNNPAASECCQMPNVKAAQTG